MDDTQKMLRAIINGQSTLKSEILSKVDQVEQKLGGKIDQLEGRVDHLDKKIDGVEKRLTDRIDKIGRQLAYLEDDTPTKEEFDNLEKKITPISN